MSDNTQVNPSSGRPTTYSLELSQEIVRRICEGESVKSICSDPDMPARSTVMLWAATDREGFSDIYAKACDARAHYWADEILDIADDGCNDWMERLGQDGQPEGYKQNGEAINRSRLRVDTRKWLMSKLLPRYSDKPEEKDASADLAQALNNLADKLPS